MYTYVEYNERVFSVYIITNYEHVNVEISWEEMCSCSDTISRNNIYHLAKKKLLSLLILTNMNLEQRRKRKIYYLIHKCIYV